MSKKTVGARLRELRLERRMSLRQVAALMDTDLAILSKMERGQRNWTKEIIKKLAKLYDYDSDELMILYLSDKILYNLSDEELSLEAISVAETDVMYSRVQKTSRHEMFQKMKDFLLLDKRVEAAWVFGSFARGDDTMASDIDILVRFNPVLKISLFDMADIQFRLGKEVHRKIDLTEEGTLMPFAVRTVENDIIQLK